eukprot:TRINITY_DN16414_c0_g1_i1.p1 TRINITY_DN16414_c0_g1~~TRINITY_DN16414_c0_g1_i1.p1  ORF type:complete len:110 (+),score=23.31 TRINITY_DN16414_c0_g1_i1:23-352(+)
MANPLQKYYLAVEELGNLKGTYHWLLPSNRRVSFTCQNQLRSLIKCAQMNPDHVQIECARQMKTLDVCIGGYDVYKSRVDARSLRFHVAQYQNRNLKLKRKLKGIPEDE